MSIFHASLHGPDPSYRLPDFARILSVLDGTDRFTSQELQDGSPVPAFHVSIAQGHVVMALTAAKRSEKVRHMRDCVKALRKLRDPDVFASGLAVIENSIPVADLRDIFNLELHRKNRLIPAKLANAPKYTAVATIVIATLGLFLMLRSPEISIKYIATVSPANVTPMEVPKSGRQRFTSGQNIDFNAELTSPLANRWLVHVNDRRATLLDSETDATGRSQFSETIPLDDRDCLEFFLVIAADSPFLYADAAEDEITFLSRIAPSLQPATPDSAPPTDAELEDAIQKEIRRRGFSGQLEVNITSFLHEPQ